MKKLIYAIIMVGVLLALASCKPKEEEPDNSVPPENTQSVENESKRTMFIDTEEYSMTFDILGEWREYAGTSPIRDTAQAVLASTAEINSAGNTFFYIVIDKFQEQNLETEDVQFKVVVVSQIKESYDSVEFLSVSDSSTETEKSATVVFNTVNGNETIKHYQHTIVLNGYQISFMYSAPSLIYDNQKGYINDMIRTAKFSVVGEAEPESTQSPES